MPTCNICKYAGRPTYKSPCSECKEFSKYEYENKKTNADRIRAMSDEELLELFMFDTPCEIIVNSGNCLGSPCNCRECILGWLRQQAE